EMRGEKRPETAEGHDLITAVLKNMLADLEDPQSEYLRMKKIELIMDDVRDMYYELIGLRSTNMRPEQISELDKLIGEFEEAFYLGDEGSVRKMYEEVSSVLKDELTDGIRFLRLWRKLTGMTADEGDDPAAQAEKDEIVGRITLGTTEPGRNHFMDLFIEKHLEDNGLLGNAVVVNLGVGYVPFTTVELAERLSGKARVIGVDTNMPAYMIVLEEAGKQYHVLFDERDEITRVIGGFSSEAWWDSARPMFPEEDSRIREKAMVLRKQLTEQISRGIDLKGEKYELVIDPVRRFDAGRDNLTFVKGGFELPVEGGLDVVRAANVFLYYSAEETNDAVERIGVKLNEGGILVVGDRYTFFVFKKYVINGEAKMVLSEFVARTGFDKPGEKEYLKHPHVLWNSEIGNEDLTRTYFHQPFPESGKTISLVSRAFRHAVSGYDKSDEGRDAVCREAEKAGLTVDSLFARKAAKYLQEAGHEAYTDPLGYMHLVIEKTPEKDPPAVPVIDFWETPGMKEILTEVAEEIERNGIEGNARFRRIGMDEVSEKINGGTCYEGTYEYTGKEGTVRLIGKKVRDANVVKDFFRTERPFACPTFFDEKMPGYVYELNLEPLGYIAMSVAALPNETGRRIMSAVLWSFRITEEWFALLDLHSDNVMVKLDAEGNPVDVKVVDWDLLKKVPETRERYMALEEPARDGWKDITEITEKDGERDLSGLKVQGVKFEFVRMPQADLRRTELERCYFCYVGLKGADFRGAVFTGPNFFDESNLEEADFRGAVFESDDAIRHIFGYSWMHKTRFDADKEELLRDMGYGVTLVETGDDTWCEVSSFAMISERLLGLPAAGNTDASAFPAAEPEKLPQEDPPAVPVIDLWEAPETAGILAEMAEEIERNGIDGNERFERVEDGIPHEIKMASRLDGVYEYTGKAGTVQIIRKEVCDHDDVKSLFKTRRSYACPTFFDTAFRGDIYEVGSLPPKEGYVYELNLLPLGYQTLSSWLEHMDPETAEKEYIRIVRTILRSYRATDEWFEHPDVDRKGNIMVKTGENGDLVDVKAIDWDFVEEIPHVHKDYVALERLVRERQKGAMRVKLEYARFRGFDFKGWDLSNMEMQSVNFDFSEMQRADFRGTGMDYCHFLYVDLKGADFRGAVFNKVVCFDNAELSMTDFRGIAVASDEDRVIKDAFKYSRMDRTRFDADKGRLFEEMGFEVEYKGEGAEAWCEVTSFETVMKRMMNAPERRDVRTRTEEYIAAATEPATDVMTHTRYPAKKYVVVIAEKDFRSAGKHGSAIPKTARRLRKEYRFENVIVKTFDGTLKDLQEVYDRMGDEIDENTRGVVFMDGGDKLNFSLQRQQFLVTNNAKGKIDFVREVVPSEGGYIAIPAHVALGVGLIDLRDGNRGNLKRIAALIEQLTQSKETARIFTENPEALFNGQLWLILPAMETVDIGSMPEVRRAEDAAEMAL
ncbi:MAG: pentapeptide repeat-containing protein, partial [Candidatus Omnitrophota bacterium]